MLNCGKAPDDIEYLKEGWDFRLTRGFLFAGWKTEVNHCWADEKSLEFEVLCPKGAQGTLLLYLLDGDNFQGGRKESVAVCGRALGDFENFQQGQWLEVPISSTDTAQGRIPVVIKNLQDKSNAVVSLVRFVSK